MEAAILDQTRFEMKERLSGFDFKGSCAAIVAEMCGMNISVPVQFGANDERPCVGWITDAQLALVAACRCPFHIVSLPAVRYQSEGESGKESCRHPCLDRF